MVQNEQEILDQFDDEPVRRWFEHWSVVYGPVATFCLGMVFRIQHWPFSGLIITIALVLILVRSIIFFFSRPRLNYEWAYFISRVVLNAALAWHFGFGTLSRRVMLAVLLVFAIGVLIYILRKRSAKQDVMENPEDDY